MAYQNSKSNSSQSLDPTTINVPVHLDTPEGRGLSQHDETFRTEIINHCKWMSKFDYAEAVRAFKQYREQLLWLKL